jgi:hypothetical protein
MRNVGTVVITPMTENLKASFARRRIAIFEPYSDFATNPTLVCLVKALTSCGAYIDLFMPVNGHFQMNNSKISQYRFPPSLSLWRGSIRKTVGNLLRRIQQKKINRAFAAGVYNLIIGVDSAGVIKGVYLSFEIFFWNELKTKAQLEEKKLECIASKNSDLIIIQDMLRAKLLAAENDLPMGKFEYLPVSPAGNPILKNTNYLRKRYKISPHTTIVLHSGAFAAWTCADELIENVKTWPKDFILVIHTKQKPSSSDMYVRAIHQSNLPVILSIDPLPMREYEQLLASADMGLVLYKTTQRSPYTGKNIQNMGLSSGKFSFYMKYGLPVISINQQSYSELLEEYDFGVNIHSFSEMPHALHILRENYTHYQKEARKLYVEKLDFNIHWPCVKNRILKVLRQGNVQTI